MALNSKSRVLILRVQREKYHKLRNCENEGVVKLLYAAIILQYFTQKITYSRISILRMSCKIWYYGTILEYFIQTLTALLYIMHNDV